MIACEKGLYHVAQLLLSNDALKNIRHDLGNTALHFAAMKGHFPVVKLLLESGARVEMQNYNGETALMLSDKHHHVPVSAMLVTAMIARFEARQGNSEFFRITIIADALLAPRQWLSLLPTDGQMTLHRWIKACIADESACFAALYAGQLNSMPLRHLPQDVIRKITPYLVYSRSWHRQALREFVNTVSSVITKKRSRN
jgi:hypothetical protein